MPRIQPRSVYQLRITLAEVEPPVWRRLLVPADTSLPRLHRLLQIVMGWTDSHLHCFEVGGRCFGMVDVEEDHDELEDERRVKLSQLLESKGECLLYRYDYGDGWEHTVALERVEQPEDHLSYPLCIGGERACPPEDSGGAGGYEDLLTALRSPEDEEHWSTLRWLGGYFDPEAFDPNGVNRLFRRMR